MATYSFSKEEMSELINGLKVEIVSALREEIKAEKELPPLLNRKQFMELTGISTTKCAELFKRSDFPVIRDFGNPKVPTKLLFDWIYSNSQNAHEINYFVQKSS